MPAVAIEEWTCPACGATVHRKNPAWKGIWFTAIDLEVTALCARQHHTHDRRGRPIGETDAAGALTWDELAASPPGTCWLPIVAADDDGSLVTPGIGLRRDGDAYVVVVLDAVAPSALVGSLRPLLERGRVVGRIDVDQLELDERAEAVDAASLAHALP
jgi:hypothetical protein